MTSTPNPYLTRPKIRALLADHGLEPSRALGQNFLCEPGLVDKIVRLGDVGHGDRVIEIGAGLGSLTVGLVVAGAEVMVVELDRHIIPALEETVAALAAAGYEGASRVEIHQGDALEFPWNEHLDGPAKVVANLPYNIATPLILDLLASQPFLDTWLVMVQREAGERLVAAPGSRIYGIPSVLVAYWADASIVATVPADVFLPRPKVASVLVRLRRHQRQPTGCSFESLAAVVRSGFGQRRKMLRRSLAGLLTAEQIEQAGIAPTARAEELGVDEWAKLAQAASSGDNSGR